MAQIDSDNFKYRANGNEYEVVDERKKKSKKIISGGLANDISKRGTIVDKFLDAFLPRNHGDIMSDIIVPALQDTILNILEERFHRATRRGYGYSGYRTRASSYDYSSRYRYDDRDRRPFDYDDEADEVTKRIDYRNIIVLDRTDAENVVRELRDYIEEYDQVSVAYLYELVGTSSTHVDEEWGWTNPRDIGIRRVRDGYLIDVPKARHLDWD